MTDALLTLKEAAAALGIRLRTLESRVERGRVPSAVKVPMHGGKRVVWMVPSDGLDTLCHLRLHREPRPIGETMLRGPGRCECCGILLERSGDGKHPADTSDAGRCWWCRETYADAEAQR